MSAMTQENRTPPDSATFRRAMGQFPTGVTLITCGSGARTEVITANSILSVSLEPVLVQVGVGAAGRMRFRLDEARTFAINVLSADQQELSAVFASRDRPRGDSAAALLGDEVDGAGNVLVDAALLSMECHVEAAQQAGDHVLFLARVTAVRMGEAQRRPLVFHQGCYRTVA